MAAFHLSSYYLERFEQGEDILLSLTPKQNVEIHIQKKTDDFYRGKRHWKESPELALKETTHSGNDWSFDLGKAQVSDYVSTRAMRREFENRIYGVCRMLKREDEGHYQYGDVLCLATTLNNSGFEPHFMPLEKVAIARTVKNICIEAVTPSMLDAVNSNLEVMVRIREGLVFQVYTCADR